MCQVHKAFHIKTGQIVAIKKAKESAADRDVGGIGFTALREVKVMNAIRHPNVLLGRSCGAFRTKRIKE